MQIADAMEAPAPRSSVTAYNTGRMPAAIARARWVLLLLLAVGAVWATFHAFTGVVLEDALITWRYSENLAAGHGFVFNPGERVLGTTTPLLALLLTPFGFALGPAAIPVAARWLMIACGLAAGLFLRDILLSCGVSRHAALLVMGLCLLHENVVWSAVGGMETMLVLMWMMGALALSLRGRVTGSLLMCTALVLTRPDGAVWGLLVGLHNLQRNGFRRVLRGMVAPAAILLAWVLFAWRYFGSVVPHSMLAKATLGGEDGMRLQAFVWDWFQWFSRNIGIGREQGLPGLVALGLWIVALLLVPLVVARRRRLLTAWPLFVFPPVFALFYLVGRAPHFPWYLVPFTWCCVACGALGLMQLLSRIDDHPGARFERLTVRAAQGSILLLVAAAFLNGIRNEAILHRRGQENEQATRAAAGDWLRTNTPVHATVAMEAIGYQGTRSGRHVIDLAGLISPEVVRLRNGAGGNADGFRRILEALKPDYLVLRTFEVAENRHFHGGPLFDDPATAAWFSRVYHAQQVFEAPHPAIWGDNASITIYARTREAGALTTEPGWRLAILPK